MKKIISFLITTVLLLVTLTSCGGAKEQKIEITPTPMPTFTAVPTVEPTAEPTIEPTAEPTAAPTAEPVQESNSAAESSSSESTQMVWVGKTGTKYHNQGCRTLKGGGHQITLSEALAEGREACAVCH